MNEFITTWNIPSKHGINASVNPSGAQPPPWLLRGIYLPFQSRGWGICKFCAAWWPGICRPRSYSRALSSHAHGFQSEYNYTEDITEKKADYKLGTAGIDWCITFWKRKKLSITFSHQNNWKIVDNSFKTKQIWAWKKKTRTKFCLVSTMTYNLSLPVRRSFVMTKRTSTKLKPTPHLISPEKFKKGIFIIKILLVNFNDVYGIIYILLIERNNAQAWAWWVETGDGAEL